MKFIETSAKDSDNVEQIFQEIATILTKQANEMYPEKNQKGNRTILDNKPTTNPINNCCSN
jgi:GTPase SAR1 family protein